jgi:type III pantothenate kinase
MTPAVSGKSHVAVDIGNSRIKFGRFDSVDASPGSLPSPTDTLVLTADWPDTSLEPWIERCTGFPWLIASVNRQSQSRLCRQLEAAGNSSVRTLTAADIPLRIEVDSPEHVGLDRLVDALAVNQLRDPTRPAVAVDVGSAITVDLISPDGGFLGGAILPGIGMAARALHEFTDLLPLVPVSELIPATAALGKNTDQALRAGLFWGAVGAIRELVKQYSAVGGDPQVFLTGGAAPAVAELLVDGQGARATYVPELTLGGIALTAASVLR